jgi:exodeoxyribonuclease VII small subunit
MTEQDEPLDDLPYGEAVDELERILAELDDEELDVDALASKVRRAAQLIRVCRSRIAGARLEIERVVTELESEAGDAGP